MSLTAWLHRIRLCRDGQRTAHHNGARKTVQWYVLSILVPPHLSLYYWLRSGDVDVIHYIKDPLYAGISKMFGWWLIRLMFRDALTARTSNYIIRSFIICTTTTNLYVYLVSPMRVICLTHLILVDLITLMIFGEEIVKHLVIL
jgi:hypothetical protein